MWSNDTSHDNHNNGDGSDMTADVNDVTGDDRGTHGFVRSSQRTGSQKSVSSE